MQRTQNLFQHSLQKFEIDSTSSNACCNEIVASPLPDISLEGKGRGRGGEGGGRGNLRLQE